MHELEHPVLTPAEAVTMSNRELVEALMAASRAEGALADLEEWDPQGSEDTPEMIVLKVEVLRRLSAQAAESV